MLTTRLLGGAALYHELESLDYETGELVIANSGEHDLAFCDPAERPTLRQNDWYLADPVVGACACFAAPAGPASLVAFTELDAPAPGYRFIVAEGEFTSTRWPATGTPHAAFRFRHEPAPQAWERWARAGRTTTRRRLRASWARPSRRSARSSASRSYGSRSLSKGSRGVRPAWIAGALARDAAGCRPCARRQGSGDP